MVSCSGKGEIGPSRSGQFWGHRMLNHAYTQPTTHIGPSSGKNKASMEQTFNARLPAVLLRLRHRLHHPPSYMPIPLIQPSFAMLFSLSRPPYHLLGARPDTAPLSLLASVEVPFSIRDLRGVHKQLLRPLFFPAKSQHFVSFHLSRMRIRVCIESLEARLPATSLYLANFSMLTSAHAWPTAMNILFYRSSYSAHPKSALKAEFGSTPKRKQSNFVT